MVSSQHQEVAPEVNNQLSQDNTDSARQKLSDEYLSQPNASRPVGSNPSAGIAADSILSAGNNGPKISDGAPQITGFLEEPGNGVQKLENAIENAHQSVQMEMFHLTDPGVVQSLTDASDHGAKVQVILDADNLAKDNASAAKSGKQSAEQTLEAHGVSVVSSSKDFRITHPKTTLIDGNTAYITSMNLTTHEGSFRDFGVSTEDPMVVNDFQNLFQADLKNAQTYQQDVQAGISPTKDANAEYTPPMVSPFMFASPTGDAPDTQALSQNQTAIDNALSSLSPDQQAAARSDFAKAIDDSSNNNQYTSSDQLNAERDLANLPNGSQLVQLFAERMQADNINRIAGIFDRAQTKVVGETENIGDAGVLNSIISAAQRGVDVNLIIPSPEESDSRLFSDSKGNKIAVQKLEDADAQIEAKGFPGIHIEEMPYDEKDPNGEYLHAKWLVADDGKEGYLGSENFTYSSLHLSRELGIIMENSPQMQQMVNAFNQDWSVAKPAPTSNS